MAGGVIGLVVGAADLCRMGRCCVRDSEAQPCCEVSRESLQTRCLTCFLGWLTDPWSLLIEARWGPATLTLAVSPTVSSNAPCEVPPCSGPSSSFCPHLLEDAGGGWAAGGVLAHTHGRVVVIHLTHLAVLAVVVLAGVWERAGSKVRACPILTSHELPGASQHRRKIETSPGTAPSISPCTRKM